MAGIYIHIPFCRQACHYCDFHFSTNRRKMDPMMQAINRELVLRRDEVNEEVQTLYFGGGTPSLLPVASLVEIMATVRANYRLSPSAEITLEANPDDFSSLSPEALFKAGINRLSIGVQSFFEADLTLMNRAHTAADALQSLSLAATWFDNISIDLIYGVPGMGNLRWLENINTALSFDIPHISVYALTVEPGTALANFIKKGEVSGPDEVQTESQFHIVCEALQKAGYVHYEISNFGRPGFFSRHNTAYWQGVHYVGIGPSAHSFDGERRGWNISNNSKYINALSQNMLVATYEQLSAADKYNERIMTGLRTLGGVSLSQIGQDFGKGQVDYLLEQARRYLDQNLLYVEDGALLVAERARFLTDGIASDLFMVNLEKV